MQELDRAATLLRAVERFSLCQTLEEIGQAAMEQITAHLGTRGGSLFLCDGEGLRRLFSYNPEGVPERIKYPLREGSPFERCMNLRQPLLLDEEAWDSRMSKSGGEAYTNDAALLLPLFDHTGDIGGLISTHNKEQPPFTERDQVVGSLLAAIASETIRSIRSSEAVRLSERRLSTLLRNMPGMAYRAVDPLRWEMDYVSDGCLALTGYEPVELCGANAVFGNLIHADDETSIRKAIQTALEQDEAFQATYRIRTKQGDEKWVWQKGVAILDEVGAVTAAEGFITDITRQRASEIELTRIATALDQASEAILITNTEGLIEYVNHSFERVSGYGQEDVLSRRRDVIPIALERSNASYAAMVESEAKGKPWKGEVRFQRKDGTVVDVMVQLAPLRNVEGQLQSIVYVMSDITAERRLKAQLFHAQKMEAIGVLASGIAHEINTPTQYIGDNLRFIRESIEQIGKLIGDYVLPDGGESVGVANEACRKYMEEIEIEYLLEEVPRAIDESLEGNDRVAAIVKAMKAFAHPEDEAFEEADLNEAVESAATVARNEWKYVADLEFDLDSTLAPVPCQIGALNQVILNLIVNAAHAVAEKREQDGETDKGRITVRTRKRDRHAEIEVSDTGCGIPEHIRMKIFDPFFTTKGVGKGTGQGLALSHTVIVEQHKGTISVDSVAGEGSTFTVRIPLEKSS